MTMILGALAGLTAKAAAVPTTPQEAIRAAVVARLGVPVLATVASVTTRVESEPGLVALPDAAARLGQPARFFLSVNGARRGLAIATVTVTASYAKAARAIARDEAIDGEAVLMIEGPLPALPIRPLLAASALPGLKARRDIAAGEALTDAVLRVPPVVKSGDAVDATVRIGRIAVTGTGTASGSGQVGDLIRIMQPHSSRLLNARIVGPGAVEIVE